MSEEPRHSSQALFRFSIVSQVNARIRAGDTRAEAVRSVAASEHPFFDGSLRRVSERSIYRWLAAHSEHGTGGLEPKTRSQTPCSSTLPAKFVDFLVVEKRRDRHASIPELVRRAKERGILGPGQAVNRSTVYRSAKRLGLPLARGKRAKDRDSRRFAYPHRMDMVLCDGKHFRAGETRQKRVALFYIDDATRYVLTVVVGTSETQQLFQRGLFECLKSHGRMSCIYFDRGPGFIAEDTASVLARLGIGFVHGESGYKEGRGKVERFNRTVKADVLRGLDGRPDVDPGLGALELRLRHYAERVYAHRPHQSLGGKTPWQRFCADPKPLRLPEDQESLESKFEVWLERRVSADHVVSVDSLFYEMPRGYAGQKVVLRRRLLDGGIGFLHGGKLIELHPVDLAGNARSPRTRNASDDEDTQPMPPVTAAELSYQRDFGPVVDEDGGLELPFPDDEEDVAPPEQIP